MMYWDIFFCFLKIGAFSFGGGYAALPLIQGEVVGNYGWLSMREFTDLVTISQMTPGSIAVNAATFVGTRLAGLPGAVIATAGCVLPACFIVTLVAKMYLKYRDMTLLSRRVRHPAPGRGGPYRRLRRGYPHVGFLEP